MSGGRYVDYPPGTVFPEGVASEHAVLEFVLAELEGCDSYLDAGCAEGRYLLRVRARRPDIVAWALDAHAPSIAEIRTNGGKLCGAMPDILDDMADASVDAIVCLDVIEHLHKEDGVRTLQQFERIARQKIILFTPKGFMPQEGAHRWQRHLSGWEPDHFEALGYEALLWRDFDYGNGNIRDALWARKVLI